VGVGAGGDGGEVIEGVVHDLIAAAAAVIMEDTPLPTPTPAAAPRARAADGDGDGDVDSAGAGDGDLHGHVSPPPLSRDGRLPPLTTTATPPASDDAAAPPGRWLHPSTPPPTPLRGRAVRVDPIKISLETAYGFSS